MEQKLIIFFHNVNERRNETCVKNILQSRELTPVILATQEAEIRRITVQSQPW
jgi:hypothetical protein